jgi:hypothetical protein
MQFFPTDLSVLFHATFFQSFLPSRAALSSPTLDQIKGSQYAQRRMDTSNRFEEAGRKTSAGYKNSLFLAPPEFSVFIQLRAPLVAGPF